MAEVKPKDEFNIIDAEVDISSLKEYSKINEIIESTLQLLAKTLNVEYCLVLHNKFVKYEFVLSPGSSQLRFKGMQREQLLQHSIKSILQADINEDFILCVFNISENKEWTKVEKSLFEIFSNQLKQILDDQSFQEDLVEKIAVLGEQNKKLKELDNLKTQLINTVSHELRTPLVSIMGFSNMLRRHEPTKELVQESSDQILQAGQRLSRMVDDFIILNRAESHGWVINNEPLDIVELSTYVVDEFAPINKKHSFKFIFPDEYPLVMADGKLLRQVFDNLIANAIKYSPRGGVIELVLEHDGAMLNFSVKDQGIGMPEEDIDKVFERFYRVQSRETEAIGGMGLGLAICKDIITSLDGKICSTSHLGSGSIFTISLPVYKEPDEAGKKS